MRYLLLLLLIPVVYAVSDDYDRAKEIDWYVDSVVTYKHYTDCHTVTWILLNKEGDCTEKALLKRYYARKARIKNRLVRGLADGKRHDWIEFRINNTWIDFEKDKFRTLRRLGYGIW